MATVLGTKHYTTAKITSSRYPGRDITTYPNTPGGVFQDGTDFEWNEPVIPDVPSSTDCTRYTNDLQQETFTKNDCGIHQHGSDVIYQVVAGTYTSAISQMDADNQALADIAANGQNYANTNGTCIADPSWVNVEKSGSASRNDCGGGYTGSSVLYTVPAGTYTSYVSQMDADAQAQADVDANKQAYANTHGTCTPAYSSVAIDGPWRKNDCSPGYSGTFVTVHIAAGAYTSIISQMDADSQAQAAAQAFANDPANGGTCLIDTNVSTLLVDYTTNNGPNLCLYVSTPGLTETDQIVAATASGGPLKYPNDGRLPADCYSLASDDLGGGPPIRRFGVNMAYYVQKYTGILTTIEFTIRGRAGSAGSVGGSYALRPITEGYLILPEYGVGSGLYIPAVSSGSSTPIAFSSNIVSGADGSVGVGVGSPILKLTYTFATNIVTITTF